LNAANGWYFITFANEGNQLYVLDEGLLIEYINDAWQTSPDRVQYLNDISDVDLTALQDGDQLQWDASNQQWVPVELAALGGATNLNELDDVDTSGIADGYALIYEASTGKWYPSEIPATGGGGGGGASSLDDLSDVDTSSSPPADGDHLVYDASNGLWYPTADTAGSGGGISTVGMTLIDSWDYSTDVTEVDFTNLGDYSDLLFIARAVTGSVSGVRSLRVSTNNGSSFDSTAGNYQSIGTGGAESNAAVAAIGFHDTNSTAARDLVIRIHNTTGPVKAGTTLNVGGRVVLYVGSADPINAVRLFNHNGGNLTAGSARLYGIPKNAGGGPTLIETVTLSADTTKDIESFALGGYSRVRLELQDIDFATNNSYFRCIHKINGTYQTAATYRHRTAQLASGGASNSHNSNADSACGIIPTGSSWGISNSSAHHVLNGYIEISNPDKNTGGFRLVEWELTHFATGGPLIKSHGSGVWEGTDVGQELDGIRLVGESAMTGTVLVIGYD